MDLLYFAECQIILMMIWFLCVHRTKSCCRGAKSESVSTFTKWMSKQKRQEKQEDLGVCGVRFLPGPRECVLAGRWARCPRRCGNGQRCHAWRAPLPHYKPAEGPTQRLVHTRQEFYLHGQLLQWGEDCQHYGLGCRHWRSVHFNLIAPQHITYLWKGRNGTDRTCISFLSLSGPGAAVIRGKQSFVWISTAQNIN